jgi:hypothetical protein
MDSLERDVTTAPRPRLQIWLDPLATECACGWHGSKLRLIPLQDSTARMCPQCLTDIGPR